MTSTKGFKVSITQLIIAMLLFISLNSIDAQKECPNLSPCDCEWFSNSYYVNCNQVPMEEVKSAFYNNANNSIDIDFLTLNIRYSGDFIPADLLGSNRLTYKLEILGVIDSFTLLEIDLDAFRSTVHPVQNLVMSNLDHSRLNFSFLASLTNLFQLDLLYSSNLDNSLPTLPEMQSLEALSFSHSTGLKEAFTSGNVINSLQTRRGLYGLSADSSSLDGKSLGHLLEWILPSSSRRLTNLFLGYNEIESIPIQLSSFTRLENIRINGNRVDMTIGNNSIRVYTDNGLRQYPYYNFDGSRIVTVESGAFQGNYSFTSMYMGSNSLTRLEEGSFKSMLQDMYLQIGSLFIGSNSFECYSDSCHLAWLLRDNRQLLDSFKQGGPPMCADGTLFTDLDLDLFQKLSLKYITFKCNKDLI